MRIDEIIVIIIGLMGIGFTYWFFLMKKEVTVKAQDRIEIIVNGGYSPSVIEIPKGKKTLISFKRLDPSSCLEEVVLPDFKIKKYLPLNNNIDIEITPQKSGEFRFECGMNMFHGKIIVGSK